MLCGIICSMGDELLTVDQAAERLQMHADTVRRLLRDGQLPGRKIGARQWRISADALKAYVEGVAPKLDPNEGARRR
jgi:excisionase family DNA binding protein